MSQLSIGLVGLPNVGKTTLFNAMTRSHAEVATYAFSTTDRNVGQVPVPDPRLGRLAEIVHPKKITPTTTEFVDVAGLVRGASEGEGLGNQFLGYLRDCDALAHVIRCFENGNIQHVDGSVDPERDVETINLELAVADLAVVQRRHDRTSRAAKAKVTSVASELEALDALRRHLNEGSPVRTLPRNDALDLVLRELNLLTAKPILYIANVDEAYLSQHHTSFSPDEQSVFNLQEIARAERARAVIVSADLEAQLLDLEPGDAKSYLESLGIAEAGLSRVIQEGYALLDLISFLTAGEPEVRAWTITRGMTAPQAAGKIHSDIERGFIRAEVTPYDDLARLGSFAAAREQGLQRLEGRDYVMQDGDVVLFRFNA
jgi:GTP-binding protein YchF